MACRLPIEKRTFLPVLSTVNKPGKKGLETVQVAVLSPALAVMMAEPTPTIVTTPSATVATAGLLVVQVTVLNVALSGATVAVSVTTSSITFVSSV